MYFRGYTINFRIWLHLSDLSSEGKTIIITTHYIEEARRAHMVGMMRSGMMLSEDAPESLMKCYGCSSLEDVFLKLCIIDTSKVIQVNCLFSRAFRLQFNIWEQMFYFLLYISYCDKISNIHYTYIIFKIFCCKLKFIEVTLLFRKLLYPSKMAYKKSCYL